jgi:hypothetical protein
MFLLQRHRGFVVATFASTCTFLVSSAAQGDGPGGICASGEVGSAKNEHLWWRDKHLVDHALWSLHSAHFWRWWRDKHLVIPREGQAFRDGSCMGGFWVAIS